MWMRLEVQLATPPIGYVGVELGRREVRMPEHLLDRTQVGPAFEQVSRERVAQQVRMDPFGLEPGLRCQPSQDQKRAGAREGRRLLAFRKSSGRCRESRKGRPRAR